MSEPEFSRMVDIRDLSANGLEIVASESERRALAERFSLVRIEALAARVEFDGEGARIEARGRLKADIVQSCAISGEDLPVRIDEPLDLLFVPASEVNPGQDEEYELAATECDEIAYAGPAFDLGEAVAQSLALAIDPFAAGPEAEDARKAHGLVKDDAPAGPFAALAALKNDKAE